MNRLGLIFVVLGALAFAACGSGGDETDATPDGIVIGGDTVTPVEVDGDVPTVEGIADVAQAEMDETAETTWTDIQDTSEPEPEPLNCQKAAGSFSGLPGVKIEFTGTTCQWLVSEALAGIEIPYQVVVDADVTFVKPQPQDAGGCGQPGASGLIVFEQLKGGQEVYCICDTGLCQGPSDTPVTLKKGTYPGKFSWDGKNWQGPSDTGTAEGKAFPAGKYTLTVSAKAKAKLYGGTTYEDVEVNATWPVELKADPLPELVEVVEELPPQDFYVPPPDETPDPGAETTAE